MEYPIDENRVKRTYDFLIFMQQKINQGNVTSLDQVKREYKIHAPGTSMEHITIAISKKKIIEKNESSTYVWIGDLPSMDVARELCLFTNNMYPSQISKKATKSDTNMETTKSNTDQPIDLNLVQEIFTYMVYLQEKINEGNITSVTNVVNEFSDQSSSKFSDYHLYPINKILLEDGMIKRTGNKASPFVWDSIDPTIYQARKFARKVRDREIERQKRESTKKRDQKLKGQETILIENNERLANAQKFAQTERPIQIKKPVQVQESVQVEKPVQVQESVQVEKPVQVQESVQVEKPVQVQEVTNIQKPVQVQKTTQIQKPIENNTPKKAKQWPRFTVAGAILFGIELQLNIVNRFLKQNN